MIKENLNELKKILHLISEHEIELGKYHTGGVVYHYGFLCLTKKGLEETTGFHDGLSDGCFSDSYQNEPKKITGKDFIRIIREYGPSITKIFIIFLVLFISGTIKLFKIKR